MTKQPVLTKSFQDRSRDSDGSGPAAFTFLLVQSAVFTDVKTLSGLLSVCRDIRRTMNNAALIRPQNRTGPVG